MKKQIINRAGRRRGDCPGREISLAYFHAWKEQKGNITKKMWRRGIDCRQRIRRRKFMEEGSHT